MGRGRGLLSVSLRANGAGVRPGALPQFPHSPYLAKAPGLQAFVLQNLLPFPRLSFTSVPLNFVPQSLRFTLLTP